MNLEWGTKFVFYLCGVKLSAAKGNHKAGQAGVLSGLGPKESHFPQDSRVSSLKIRAGWAGRGEMKWVGTVIGTAS